MGSSNLQYSQTLELIPQKVFAVIDCNNFFVSCERVFNPALQKRPVIVLSSNDGCIVARSNEVKTLGIKMGRPVFEYRDMINTYNIILLSSNFALYRNMSQRIMTILASYCPFIEVYSIDEAFLDLTAVQANLKDLPDFGRQIREDILTSTGIPVSVGIGSTKTLVKGMSVLAKKEPAYNGVISIAQKRTDEIDALLQKLSSGDIWGIGRHTYQTLLAYGIHSAKDFKYADSGWVTQRLKSNGEKILLELHGISCIPLLAGRQDKKSILSSRSFGTPITQKGDLEEAVATFTARAAEKLFIQRSAVSCIEVFIRIRKEGKSYTRSRQAKFSPPASYAPTIIQKAIELTESLYKPGEIYKKAGIRFSSLVPSKAIQSDLFETTAPAEARKRVATMKLMQDINQRLGKRSLFWAKEGTKKTWKARDAFKSPNYTGNWYELPIAS